MEPTRVRGAQWPARWCLPMLRLWRGERGPAAPSGNRLRRGGEASPSARGALGRSSRPASAAAPAGGGERGPRLRTMRTQPRSRAASARRRLRHPRGLARTACTHSLGGGARHARHRSGSQRAGGKGIGTRLGRNLARMVWASRPRPLRPPRATQTPAAGARCGDVTAGARSTLLQVRWAAATRSP